MNTTNPTWPTVPVGAPTPLSRLQTEAGRVTQALRSGRRVPVTKRGEVVAVIDPVDLVPQVFLAARSAGMGVVDEVNAREFSRGNISHHLVEAEAGRPRLLTRSQRVVGALRVYLGAGDSGVVDDAYVESLGDAQLALIGELAPDTDRDAAFGALADLGRSFPRARNDATSVEQRVAGAAVRSADLDASSAVSVLGGAALEAALGLGADHPVALIALHNLVVRLIGQGPVMVWMAESLRSVVAGLDQAGLEADRMELVHHNQATVAGFDRPVGRRVDTMLEVVDGHEGRAPVYRLGPPS